MSDDDDGTLAGWHRDPSARHELRFWDGLRWTEHVIDDGIPGLDHPTRSGRPPKHATTTPAPEPPEGTGPAPEAPESAAPAAATPAPTPVAAAAPPEPTTPIASPAAAPAATGPIIDLAAAEVETPAAASTARSEPANPATRHAAESTTERGSRAPDADPALRHHTMAVSTPTAPPAEPASAPNPRPPTDDPAPRARELPRLAEPRVVAAPPSVASPAGSSSGSTTSAIADPHRTGAAGGAAPPRVTSIVGPPVKRYRPGSPPASPHVGARALVAPSPIVTPSRPWYRRASAWLAIVGVIAIAAGTVAVSVLTGEDDAPGRAGIRAPARAPAGTELIEESGAFIAAPKDWNTTSGPSSAFDALDRTHWGTPLVATSSDGQEALLIVQLVDPRRDPLADADLFWSDQRRTGSGATKSPVTPLKLHGYRANRVTITAPDVSIEAAAIDGGTSAFLVAVRAPTKVDATTTFERIIQTFDVP